MKAEKLENKIRILDQNGNSNEYELLAYLQLDEGNYLVYTNGDKMDSNHVLLYVNSVIYENGYLVLSEVEKEDLPIIINKIKERVLKK